jgi:hypothetical protein
MVFMLYEQNVSLSPQYRYFSKNNGCKGKLREKQRKYIDWLLNGVLI